MITIRRLLGKDDKFMDYLEASALEAQGSVHTLVDHLRQPDQLTDLQSFVALRRKDKAITTRIRDELCTAFVTVLEREDIEALATALYKIPKTVEKIAERVMLAPNYLQGVDMARELGLLSQAADVLLTMMRELRRGVNLERIKVHNDQLQRLEGDADKALVELLGRLYLRQEDTVKTVYLKDVFELLERVADRCRDAGNAINHIVLKNS